MTIKQKVVKLKISLMKGRMIRVMKDYIKRLEDKERGGWAAQSCSLCSPFVE